ncbi:hypothetical protein [Spongiactinospora sp. TRM90649]|uniref:hypothetical protein n=1 Tax=Spongiactinospora sp. TRM90649 TaxID=3031114 RepID=UPI0023F6379E|nr:hypothetical protein [Spongiactinospora sp. TRM90649]MDF5753972.1 hypothetical protein [Spongiactinospora sp. TRM90649]
MIKKLCVTTTVLGAATAAALLAAPAHADAWTNWTANDHAVHSGNLFGRMTTSAIGGAGSTNVNNINGTVANAKDGSVSVNFSVD